MMAQLGIVHLLVISGAHLIWLDHLLRQLSLLLPAKLRSFFRLHLLLLFTLCCGIQAPVLRSTFSLILWQTQKKFLLQWTPGQKVGLSALLCLPFIDQGLNSLSLQLSWAASLALNLPLQKPYQKTKQAAFAYFFLAPLLAPFFALPHPLSILTNAALASGLLKLWLSLCLGQVLLPLPFIQQLGDQALGLSLGLLHQIHSIFPAPLMADPRLSPNLRELSWLYLGALQTFVLLFEVRQGQSLRSKASQ